MHCIGSYRCIVVYTKQWPFQQENGGCESLPRMPPSHRCCDSPSPAVPPWRRSPVLQQSEHLPTEGIVHGHGRLPRDNAAISANGLIKPDLPRFRRLSRLIPNSSLCVHPEAGVCIRFPSATSSDLEQCSSLAPVHAGNYTFNYFATISNVFRLSTNAQIIWHLWHAAGAVI